MSRSMSHGSMAQVATIYRGYPAKPAVDRERRRLGSPFGPTRQRAEPVSSACDPSRHCQPDTKLVVPA